MIFIEVFVYVSSGLGSLDLIIAYCQIVIKQIQYEKQKISHIKSKVY